MLKISMGSGINLGENGSLERFEYLKELGFDAADYQPFCTEPGKGVYVFSEKEFDSFFERDKENARKAGIEIIQTHGLWPYDDTDPTQYESKLDAMKKSIKGSALVGAKYVVMHPVMPTMWEPSEHHAEHVLENIKYFGMLAEYAKEYNVKIALENMPGRHMPCGTAKELADCIDAIDSEYVVACFDTGHAVYSGQRFVAGDNIGDAVRTLSNRLHCLHIHDNDGQNDQHMLPYAGIIDWQDFFNALREIKYQGVINMEASSLHAPKELKLSMDRLIADIAKHIAINADYRV